MNVIIKRCNILAYLFKLMNNMHTMLSLFNTTISTTYELIYSTYDNIEKHYFFAQICGTQFN